MRSILTSTTARLGASLVAALGLAPLAACDSTVETTDGTGGGGGSTSTSMPVTSSSTSSSSSPDHPPTCEELSTSAQGGVTTVGGAGGGGDGGFGTGGSDDDGLYARPCENPTAVLVGCLDTGVDQCDSGFFVRREAVACPAWHRPASEFSCTANAENTSCTVDADCGAGSTCDQSFLGPPAGDGCSCAPGCETDADCGDGLLCLCGAGGGSCVAATCRTDADCGPGARCASVETGGCNPSLAFACQTEGDACGTAAECPIDSIGGAGCVVGETGSRICTNDNGCMAAGRPLVVHGEARFAPIEGRADWSRATEASCPPEALRAEVSARWAHVAAMEHASVASFARFAMDLLAFGAPPELVASASAAMLDEIEHARLAFGLAGTFGGRAIGPGPLDVGGATGAADLVELAVATFLEGCIAEGAAAAEAAVAAATAQDPAVVAVLERIAREEAQHAELGWKTIAWALERDARVAPALEAALARAEAAPAESGAEPHLETWGLLGPAERSAVRAETLRTVVRPVLGQLLARQPGVRVSGAAGQASARC